MTRRHLVEDLLEPAGGDADLGPGLNYDQDRDLTVLADGSPLVEHAPLLGTVTATKTTGEGRDQDTPMLTTVTKIAGEGRDTDRHEGWASTSTHTRRAGGDVDDDR